MLLRLYLLLSLLLAPWLSITSRAEPLPEAFHGTVIDAESGKPLKGAVVTFVWYRVPRIYMDKIGYFHSAVEVTTDDEGRFSVPNSPKGGWSLWTYLDKDWPTFVIFKPNYEPDTIMTPHLKSGETTWDGQLRALLRGAVVTLPRLQTREQLLRFSAIGNMGIGSSVPRSALPRLGALVSEHQKMLDRGIVPDLSQRIDQ